jgi:hypothetical protein
LCHGRLGKWHSYRVVGSDFGKCDLLNEISSSAWGEEAPFRTVPETEMISCLPSSSIIVSLYMYELPIPLVVVVIVIVVLLPLPLLAGAEPWMKVGSFLSENDFR